LLETPFLREYLLIFSTKYKGNLNNIQIIQIKNVSINLNSKMDFYELENKDGVRFSWNQFPPNKLALVRTHVPLGCLYTPFKDLESSLFVEYKPLTCERCKCVLNPFTKVDFKGKWWLCVFCSTRNNFPKDYADNISESSLPAELMSEYTTMEYLLPNPGNIALPSSVYLFLIDTCMPKEELQAIKDSIFQSLSMMPPETSVGLITYGRYTFVHEVGFAECSKSYAFRGDKDYTTAQVLEMLGIASKHDPRGPQASGGLKKFILPISECESSFSAILEDLQPDPWVVPGDERPYRSTGTSLAVAISLMEAAHFGQGVRILNFLSGPCTHGSGQVVGVKLQETIRSWIDIQKDNDIAKYVKKATKYYQGLAERAIKAQLAIDIFAFTTDQFGLLEMKSMSERTGGIMLTNELFNSQVFKDTFKKIFDKDANGDLRFGFCGELTLNVTKEVRISGALGPCTSLKKTYPYLAEEEIGQSGTNAWYIGGVDKCSTIAFYLDLIKSEDEKKPQIANTAFFQFAFRYRHPSGKYRLRITTVSKKFSNRPDEHRDLIPGFDQEAACLLVSRLALHKTEKEEPLEVIRWLDRNLIRVATKFGVYDQSNINSFRLPKEFSLYPQFIFHLRRSNFVQTFAASPDESAYFRGMLNRENTTNCLVMIQPSLLLYSFDVPEPQPVVLDIASMKNNVILLLDTFFDVVVWEGEMIKKWEKAGYQDQPEYENFKLLLQAPLSDAKVRD
jgi:protein transport protein SEC23